MLKGNQLYPTYINRWKDIAGKNHKLKLHSECTPKIVDSVSINCIKTNVIVLFFNHFYTGLTAFYQSF